MAQNVRTQFAGRVRKPQLQAWDNAFTLPCAAYKMLEFLELAFDSREVCSLVLRVQAFDAHIGLVAVAMVAALETAVHDGIRVVWVGGHAVVEAAHLLHQGVKGGRNQVWSEGRAAGAVNINHQGVGCSDLADARRIEQQVRGNLLALLQQFGAGGFEIGICVCARNLNVNK